MHDTAGMSQSELEALVGVLSPLGPDRAGRRALKRRMRKPVKSSTTRQRRKIDRDKRRNKNREARKSRAKNRGR